MGSCLLTLAYRIRVAEERMVVVGVVVLSGRTAVRILVYVVCVWCRHNRWWMNQLLRSLSRSTDSRRVRPIGDDCF